MAAMTPRFGGQIVAELVTIKTRSEPSYTYRITDGFVIERVRDIGCYVSKIGRPEDTILVHVDLISRDGDETPDDFELAMQHLADEASERLVTANDVDRLFDMEFSSVLQKVPANMNEVAP